MFDNSLNEEKTKEEYLREHYEMQRLSQIVRETHNEYGRYGKHKVLKVICERAGVDMKTARKAFDNFGISRNEYNKMEMWKKTNEELLQEQEQQLAKEQQQLVRAQTEFYKSQVHCPKCRSTSISYDTKKLSIGRAIVGDAIAGVPGAILGGLSSKKGYAVCLNCGKRWKV